MSYKEEIYINKINFNVIYVLNKSKMIKKSEFYIVMLANMIYVINAKNMKMNYMNQRIID